MSQRVVFEESVFFEAEGIQYASFADSKDPSFQNGAQDEPRLCTVIPVPDNETEILEFITRYVEKGLEEDDILKSAFLSGIIVVLDPNVNAICNISSDQLPRHWNTRWVKAICKTDLHGQALAGPCLAARGKLGPVLRLYEDAIGAFSVPTRVTHSNELLPLRVHLGGHNCTSVGVSSRLLHENRTARPLDGIRVTVKAIFDVAGFRTSLGSRDYLHYQDPSHTTAPAISRLVDLGCEVVGLSNMCAMVLNQLPTQSVDFPAPWNPRADGWQIPNGGSSGQGVAVAAYEWLDFAIGSDSTMSGRMPAQAAGVFSLRPSYGALSREGMWSGVPIFDTPCLFGRDLKRFRGFAQAWYGQKIARTKCPLPHSVVIFDDFRPNEGENKLQMNTIEAFVRDVEACLGIRAKYIDIGKLWERRGPPESRGIPLKQYLDQETVTATVVYSFWQQLKPYWENFPSRFGHKPFLPLPAGIDVWAKVKTVTPQCHEEALRRISIYKDWIHKTVLELDNLNTLVLIPLGDVKPQYRTEWPGLQFRDQMLWSSLLLSPILGAPELVVPVGELPFDSVVSGQESYLPVCISIMGAPGSDLDLIDTALRILLHSGRRTFVKTGKRMFQ
ncbi:amidase signature domain-containing protein [Lophiotrema nucula]|uniref:Amidase signature domain-containing protein n=1 Tax=Lophiotrema nucula TaxID=690887 RepID=A0A6A5YNF5_9PLEO|nr:amidase signature domain-containing protein [Lophiotrema nucula]